MVVLACLLVAGAALSGTACDPAKPLAGPVVHRVGAGTESRGVVLAPNADTYVSRGHPNRNHGTEPELHLNAAGDHRVLLGWDPEAIGEALGGDSLVAAHLELTITEHGHHWGGSGRRVDLHRLTQAWTKAGATWNCADDANPGNRRADCEGETAWEMGHPKSLRPWDPEPSATRRITKARHGILRFDVTRDVAAMPSGSGAHYGRLLKKRTEDGSGRVGFGWRESESPPRLVLTVAPQGQDTSRAPIPASFTHPLSDTTLWVAPPPTAPSDTLVRYYRTIIGIRFDDTTSGVTIRRVLQRYSATIIGGLPFVGEYIVRVPDPGPTFDALARLIGAISNEPGVDYAAGITFRSFVKPYARYPNDGIRGQRRDWLGAATDATRAWRQVRAPLAWGCETGAYDQERVKVGVIDFLFDTSRDFDGAPVSLTEPGAADVTADPQLRNPKNRSHGTAVAAALAATGDNGIGVAGMLWRSELFLFALSRNDSLTVRDPTAYLDDAFLRATKGGVRVLVASVNAGPTDSL